MPHKNPFSQLGRMKKMKPDKKARAFGRELERIRNEARAKKKKGKK